MKKCSIILVSALLINAAYADRIIPTMCPSVDKLKKINTNELNLTLVKPHTWTATVASKKIYGTDFLWHFELPAVSAEEEIFAPQQFAKILSTLTYVAGPKQTPCAYVCEYQTSHGIATVWWENY